MKKCAAVGILFLLAVGWGAYRLGKERGRHQGIIESAPSVKTDAQVRVLAERLEAARQQAAGQELRFRFVNTLGPRSPEEIASHRRQAMARDLEDLRRELQDHGGDWAAWHERLAPFRQDLQGRLDRTPEQDVLVGMFPARDGHVYARKSVELIQAGDLERYRDPQLNQYAVDCLIHMSRGFKKLGIDFIYVPIPMNLEVHPEFASDRLPDDGIVAPFLRKAILRLLEGDVETLNLLPVFLERRHTRPDEPLYLSQDIHWSNAAVRLTAELIAERLMRYPVVREGQVRVPLYRTEEIITETEGKYAERRPDRRKFPTLRVPSVRVRMPDGTLFEGVEDGPIALLGDSFVYYFHTSFCKNGGLGAHLSRDTGLPIVQVTSSGMMPEELRLRLDEVLRPQVKVVIYAQDIRQLVPSGEWALFPIADRRK